MKNYLHPWFILISCITLLGGILRFYNLSSYPVGFHGDEASLAYNGYSILKTGRDENGQWFPLHSYISKTYRPIGYTYLTIVPIAIGGLTEFSARFPGALFGTGTIIAIYFLSQQVFNNKRISLISAFLLAINPWHITLSRASSESLVALFFMVAGYLFFLLLWTAKRPILYGVLTITSVLLSFITYPAPRVVIPLLLVGTLGMFLLQRKVKRNTVYVAGVIVVIILLDMSLIFGTKGGSVKFADVGILTQVEPKAILAESIREEGGDAYPAVTRLFHNKLKTYTSSFFNQYFNYFTYSYLFEGTIFPIRYTVPQMGLFHMFELPLFGVGFFLLARRIRGPSGFIPLLLLLVGPAAAALTWEDTPNILRSLPMVPGLVLVNAYAADALYHYTPVTYRRTFAITSSIIILYSLLYYIHQYYIHGKVHRPWYRDYGFAELVSRIATMKNRYTTIIITKAKPGPYIQFLFYLKYDPARYMEEGSKRDDDYSGFDGYIFVPESCPSPTEVSLSKAIPPEILRGKTLYVVDGACKKGQDITTEHAVITQPDTVPVFKIWE